MTDGGTWEDMGDLTWADLDQLTWQELESFVADALPVLRELSPDEVHELEQGITAGELPPALVASASSQYTRVEAAALNLWARASHINTDRKLAIAGLIIGLLPYAGVPVPGQGGPSADEVARRVVEKMQEQEQAEQRDQPATPPVQGPPAPGGNAP